MKATIINCTLKPSGETSNTEALAKVVETAIQARDVETELVRALDFRIKPGVESDMGSGDEWPQLLEKLMASEILVIATPTWLGRPSSVAQRVLERMDAMIAETDDEDRPVAYNRVAGVVVTGNEDGAHHVISEVSGALGDIGYTIPGQAWTYWNKGPGPGRRVPRYRGGARLVALDRCGRRQQSRGRSQGARGDPDPRASRGVEARRDRANRHLCLAPLRPRVRQNGRALPGAAGATGFLTFQPHERGAQQTLSTATTDAPTKNRKLTEWVSQVAELTEPESIHWCDGSAEEYDALCMELVENGTFEKLSDAKRPNSYLARSDPGDVARVEDRTFICSPSEAEAGPDQQLGRPGRDARASSRASSRAR